MEEILLAINEFWSYWRGSDTFREDFSRENDPNFLSGCWKLMAFYTVEQLWSFSNWRMQQSVFFQTCWFPKDMQPKHINQEHLNRSDISVDKRKKVIFNKNQ